MTHAFLLPVLLVVVAIVGLVIVGILTLSKKKRADPAVNNAEEMQRIQERLASSRIARRASGSRRKVVAIRPPADEETVSPDTEKMPIADTSEPPAENTSGH